MCFSFFFLRVFLFEIYYNLIDSLLIHTLWKRVVCSSPCGFGRETIQEHPCWTWYGSMQPGESSGQLIATYSRRGVTPNGGDDRKDDRKGRIRTPQNGCKNWGSGFMFRNCPESCKHGWINMILVETLSFQIFHMKRFCVKTCLRRWGMKQKSSSQ